MPRKRNLFDPASKNPYRISRSGLELFHECPRCFYFDKRLGHARPSGFPFNLNSAVDALLKREFDVYRRKRLPHPLMERAGIKAIPFTHPDLERWRANFTGIQSLHQPTNMLVTGAVDDLWENTRGELIVVDYKSTAKAAEVTELNDSWHSRYKRQIEIYQWLLRQNGFNVSTTAYWVYANGDAAAEQFAETLRFRMTVIAYEGSVDWVEELVMSAKRCLLRTSPPQAAEECEYCEFAARRT